MQLNSLNHACRTPFDTMYLQRGWASLCCPNWYTAFDRRQNLDQSPHDLWRNAINELHRTNVVDSASNCRNCPLRDDAAMKKAIDQSWQSGPRFLHISDSFTCNLHCWSCRKSVLRSEEEPERHDAFLRRVLDAFRDRLEVVSMLNTGEVFASRRHVSLLETFDWGSIALDIITNATLLPLRKPVFYRIAPLVREFIVSLDASNRETYERVRLGGDWFNAVEGVGMIAKTGKPLTFHYVISDANAHDVAAFASWAQQWNPKVIKFIPIARTYPRDDWDDRDPFLPSHSLHDKLSSALAEALTYPNAKLVA